MRGTKYTEGRTFRSSVLSTLRAEYAASLRDVGLSYTGIAWALGLHGKRRRAFQIVKHGRKLRDTRVVARVGGTIAGSLLDAQALTIADMRRYLEIQTAALARDAADKYVAETVEPCPYCRNKRLCLIHDDYRVEVTCSTVDDGSKPMPYVAPGFPAPRAGYMWAETDACGLEEVPISIPETVPEGVIHTIYGGDES